MASRNVVREIRKATRRKFSAEEKIHRLTDSIYDRAWHDVSSSVQRTQAGPRI